MSDRTTIKIPPSRVKLPLRAWARARGLQERPSFSVRALSAPPHDVDHALVIRFTRTVQGVVYTYEDCVPINLAMNSLQGGRWIVAQMIRRARGTLRSIR